MLRNTLSLNGDSGLFSLRNQRLMIAKSERRRLRLVPCDLALVERAEGGRDVSFAAAASAIGQCRAALAASRPRPCLSVKLMKQSNSGLESRGLRTHHCDSHNKTQKRFKTHSSGAVASAFFLLLFYLLDHQILVVVGLLLPLLDRDAGAGHARIILCNHIYVSLCVYI